jgi:Zn-dependent protease with chaperone function
MAEGHTAGVRRALGSHGPVSSPAAAGAGRAFGAALALASLAAVSIAVAVLRVLESWRVGQSSSVGRITILGQHLSYPAANVGAIAVLTLAAVGLVMAAATISRLGRELLGDRRFRIALRRRAPRELHGAWVFEDERPQAFCAGLVRPRVYISTAALELLDDDAVAAVLAHERHHASNRDPLRLACARALAAGMPFVPTLRRLLQRQHALAEIGADDAALRAEGVDRSALASAMLRFSESGGPGAVGVDAERIDNLLGEPTPWHFPLLLCAATALMLSLVLTLALLAGRVASGTATLAPPFLSGQPCVVILALLPAGALALGASRARARRALVSLSSGESRQAA